MQTHDAGGLRVTYPDQYQPTSKPRPTPSRRGDAAGSQLPDDAQIEAAFDEILETTQVVVADTFAFEAPPSTRALRDAGPEERLIGVEVDTEAGESAAILVNRDGVYSWMFPRELADGRRSTRQAVIEEQRTLTFEIPLIADAATDRGLFDVGEMVVGWVKGKVLKFAAGAAAGFATKILERGVDPGLVVMKGDDPDSWLRLDDFRGLDLPDDRPARILLMIHGTFSSTVASYRGLTTTKWGKQLLEDLNSSYDCVVGIDHPTLSETPDANAADLLRRIEARKWKHAPQFVAVSYSRGGLVLRSLVEALLPHSRLKRRLPGTAVKTAVFVGATNAGTELANPGNWHALIDLYTNLATGAAKVLALAGGPTVPTLVGEAMRSVADFAKYLATEAIDARGIPGLAAMDPDGEFIHRINQTQQDQPRVDEIEYHAVVSDFEATLKASGVNGELPKRLVLATADKIVDQLMGEPNDLVVNTRSMTAVDDPADGYVRGVLDFGSNPNVYHLVYFTQEKVGDAIRQWLGVPAKRGAPRAAADPIPQFDAQIRTVDVEAVSARPAAARAARVRPKLKIEVVWGDLRKAGGDVFAVGHYRGVLPQAAELALDYAISGPSQGDNDSGHLVLTSMTRRNLIRGELGDIDLFPWHKPKERIAAICGMGFQGSFNANSLRSLYRNLGWSVMSLPERRELTTVLIGAGTGNLSTREALWGMLTGLGDALSTSKDGLARLRIVEFERTKAVEIYEILKGLTPNDETRADLPPVDIELYPKSTGTPFAGAGGKIDDRWCLMHLLDAIENTSTDASSYDEVRTNLDPPVRAGDTLKQLDEVKEKQQTLPAMIRWLTREPETPTPTADGTATDRVGFYLQDGQIRASAIANEGATVPERVLRLDPRLLEDAAYRMTDPDKDTVVENGTLLHGLVVPQDFRSYLENRLLPLVVEVDRTTAPIHWEMLTDRGADDSTTGSPAQCIGLTRPVARQLRTVYSPPPAWRRGPGGTRLNALVIGDPGDPEKRHNLPGARDEAMTVARVLSNDDHFENVHVLIGAPGSSGRGVGEAFDPATRIDVLRLLINERIDLIHYAGHGDYDPEDPSKTGWLFKDGMLTAGEISRVDRVPPLVVANACLTAQLERNQEAERHAAALLPSLADEFFKRGVLNYIGTAWQIDDYGAVAFAEQFYKGFLGGENLGRCLLGAREHLDVHHGPLWAAYQHYGDPTFTIKEF